MTAKCFSASSLPMQRTSIEAAAALMSSGNSRNTKRTWPVSIYFERSIGKTFSPNAAQCGQLIEAYSVIVTGAFGEPIAMSGNDTGLATAPAVALCAFASRSIGGARNASRTMNPRATQVVRLRTGKEILREWMPFSDSQLSLSKRQAEPADAGELQGRAADI